MNLQDILTIGDGGCERYLRRIWRPLVFLYHSIDGIAKQTHDGLTEHVRIAVQGHRITRQVEDGLDVILLLLLGEVVIHHLLVLLQHRQQVHVDIATSTVFQHLFHSLEGTCGVLSVLVYILQVLSQHV